MKNEKFCFSKGTGLIALVGVLLVGFVLFTQAANTPTSSNTKASGVSCSALGGLRTTQSCSAFLDGYYPTPETRARYQVEDVTRNVTATGFTGNCCKIKAATAFDCSTVTNTLKESFKKETTGRMYACTYYTGMERKGIAYNGTAANDCAVAVYNDYACAGMNTRELPVEQVTPFTTVVPVDQTAYCGNLPTHGTKPGIKNTVSKVESSVVPYGSAAGAAQVVVACRYYNGKVLNNGVQGKAGCATTYTTDSTICNGVAVGGSIGTAGACSTKKCTNGLTGNDTCVKIGTNQEGLKCKCTDNASTTELPRIYACE